MAAAGVGLGASEPVASPEVGGDDDVLVGRNVRDRIVDGVVNEIREVCYAPPTPKRNG